MTEPLDIEAVEARLQEALVRRAVRARATAVLYPILVAAALALLWEIGSRVLHIPTFLVPAPSSVVSVLGGKAHVLVRHGWTSTQEIVLGYVLSIVVGIPLALGIYFWPPFARSVYPLLVSSQAVPKTAIAPVFVVWFGFGLLPKVLIAFLIAFFPIVINTVIGLASLEAEKIYLARSMAMGPLSTFFKIRLPHALPSIFGGLKIAITLAVVGAVVGEFVGADAGLGHLLLEANGAMDTPLLFAGLVGLTVIGVVFFLLIETAERLAIPWHVSSRTTFKGESL